MSSSRPQRKSALRAALDSYAEPKNRDDILKLTHAVLSTAMVKSALEKGDEKSSVKKAAKAECFAECIELIEEELGEVFSPFLPKKQTVLTTPAGMPASSVIRANESKRTEPQTAQT